MSAATTTELRRLRAVTFVACADVSTDGFSTRFACWSSWAVVVRSCSAVDRRSCSKSWSVVESEPDWSALLIREIWFSSVAISYRKFAIFWLANAESLSTTARAITFAVQPATLRLRDCTVSETSGV